ncbi:MAG: hypothetical protein ACR2GA_01430 [Chloroflexota bacterium]
MHARGITLAPRHLFSAGVALIAALSLTTIASASAMHIKQQKVAGPYRLVLVIGPAEMMSMAGHKGTEVGMPGGKMAACRMKSSGMSMHTSSMGEKICNHHVELHVYNAHSGRVISNARVTISIQDAAKHMKTLVPIMMMRDPRMGMRDLHYGNNVYAGPGSYTIDVTVGRLATTFKVRLS